MDTGRSQLPYAKNVLTYLEKPGFVDNFPHAVRRSLIIFCLSLSRFSNAAWKRTSIAVAERIAESISEPGFLDMLLSARISLRRRELHRLFPGDSPQTHVSQYNMYPPNVLSQAYLADQLFLTVQCLIDKDQLPTAWAKLKTWQPLNPNSPSSLEKRILQQIDLYRIKICRFSGRFPEATELIEKLWGHEQTSSIAASLLLCKVSVLCELEQFRRYVSTRGKFLMLGIQIAIWAIRMVALLLLKVATDHHPDRGSMVREQQLQ